MTQRIIGMNVTLNLPVGPCDVPNIVFLIAQDLRIPAGGELLPGPCGYEKPSATTQRISLIGMRFGEVLELLMKTDSRYRWMESNGVILVRPMEAWNNDKHFLHTTVDRVEIKDDNVGAALDAILVPLRGEQHFGAQLLAGVGQLTLSLGPMSMIEALDAMVRTHGEARWMVSYCVPEVDPNVATVWVRTYDKHGIGAPAGRRPIVDGKPMSCAPPPGR